MILARVPPACSVVCGPVAVAIVGGPANATTLIPGFVPACYAVR